MKRNGVLDQRFINLRKMYTDALMIAAQKKYIYNLTIQVLSTFGQYVPSNIYWSH